MAEETKIAMKLEDETKNLKKIAEKLEETIKYEFDKGIQQVDVEEMGKAMDMLKDVYEAKEKVVKACYYAGILDAMEKAEEEGGEGGEGEEMYDEERRGYRGQPRSQSGRFMSRGDGRRSNRGGRGRGRGRRGYENPMMMDEDDMEDWDDMEYMRDMDRGMGKMYYSGGGSGGSSSGGSSGGSGGRSGGSGGSSGGSGGQGGGQSSSGGSSGGGGSMGYSEGGRGSQGGGRDSREGRSGQSRRGYMEAKEQGKDKQEKMQNLEEYMKELSSDVTEMIEGASPEEKTMLKNKMQVLMQKIQ